MSATGFSRSTPVSRARRVAVDPALVMVLLATLLGLALRLAASTGDLGLDEVWSSRLVERLSSLGQVFWGLSHDNNHYLNSAWLYGLGPRAPIWAERLPAIVLGTLTVPALARLCGRANPAAGVLAAMFGAVALPLVDFGSEARGYAGLALASVLAFDAAARGIDASVAGDRATARRAAWRLGGAVGFGLLCHLTMAYTVAVVGLAALIGTAAHRRPVAAAAILSRIFAPSALLALPAIGCVVAGILARGTFTFGDADPFTAAKLADGFGGMALLTAGLPDDLPGILGVMGALALLATAARRRLVTPWSVALGVAALVALPLGVAALHLPNVGYPRYFAASGLVLLVLLAESFGTLWSRGGEARRMAAISASALVMGSLALDGLDIRDGRGDVTGTLALMSADGPPTYTASRPFMAAMLLDEAARRAGRPGPTPVAEAETCRTPPRWYLAVGTYDPRPDGAVTAGAPDCPERYRRARAYRASPLSGTQWTLYRRS